LAQFEEELREAAVHVTRKASGLKKGQLIKAIILVVEDDVPGHFHGGRGAQLYLEEHPM
jgi:hypothetical protein